MKNNPETGALSPFDFNDIYDEFPTLRKLDVDIEVLSFKPIDSSNVTPELWVKLARIIRDNYAAFDGFVILHGTDTMAYTASTNRSCSPAARFPSASCGRTAAKT